MTDNDSRPPTPGGGGGGSGGGRSSGGGGGGGGSSNRAPEITGPKSLQYPEHSTEPVATYEAEDPEGTEIRWEIEDSDSEHFRISDEGVLRFITPPDYENPVDFRLNNTYEIRLLAFDSGSPSRSDRLKVRIEIKRVNELDPVNGESQASIAEDHSGPIGQYQAEDPEGDAVAWSLTGPDSALFQIDEAGTLSLNAALDFEALGSAAGTNDYSVTIVATDDGKPPVSQQLEVTVTLTDVNEEPISIPVPLVELTEGNLPTTLDLSEFFTDPDGDSLTYTLGDAADSNVASAVVEDSTLSITPLEDGTASFLVTATDPAGLSAAGTIEVSVVSPPPPEPTPTPRLTHTHTHPRLSQRPHPRLSQRPHLPLCLQLPQRLRPHLRPRLRQRLHLCQRLHRLPCPLPHLRRHLHPHPRQPRCPYPQQLLLSSQRQPPHHKPPLCRHSPQPRRRQRKRRRLRKVCLPGCG